MEVKCLVGYSVFHSHGYEYSIAGKTEVKV